MITDTLTVLRVFINGLLELDTQHRSQLGMLSFSLFIHLIILWYMTSLFPVFHLFIYTFCHVITEWEAVTIVADFLHKNYDVYESSNILASCQYISFSRTLWSTSSLNVPMSQNILTTTRCLSPFFIWNIPIVFGNKVLKFGLCYFEVSIVMREPISMAVSQRSLVLKQENKHRYF